MDPAGRRLCNKTHATVAWSDAVCRQDQGRPRSVDWLQELLGVPYRPEYVCAWFQRIGNNVEAAQLEVCMCP